MMEEVAIYEALPAASSHKVERCAIAIDKAKASGIALIFEIGRQLQIAHDELANHGDGTFGKWVVERCGMSRMTAQRYLNVVEVFANQKRLDCNTVLQTFDAKALYYLARETTPEAAIADALKAAKKGERITIGRAKELVEQRTVLESNSHDCELMLSGFDLSKAIEKFREFIQRQVRECPESDRPHLVGHVKQLIEDWCEGIGGAER